MQIIVVGWAERSARMHKCVCVCLCGPFRNVYFTLNENNTRTPFPYNKSHGGDFKLYATVGIVADAAAAHQPTSPPSQLSTLGSHSPSAHTLTQSPSFENSHNFWKSTGRCKIALCSFILCHCKIAVRFILFYFPFVYIIYHTFFCTRAYTSGWVLHGNRWACSFFSALFCMSPTYPTLYHLNDVLCVRRRDREGEWWQPDECHQHYHQSYKATARTSTSATSTSATSTLTTEALFCYIAIVIIINISCRLEQRTKYSMLKDLLPLLCTQYYIFLKTARHGEYAGECVRRKFMFILFILMLFTA